jgi:hypothetical protein
MEPITTTVIATILITKVLEKSGEKLGELLIEKMGQSIAKIRQHSPETALALEAGNTQVLNLYRGVLPYIPSDPIFGEFLVAADTEKNTEFQEKFQSVKTGGTINIIGKQININQDGTSNNQTNTFGDF